MQVFNPDCTIRSLLLTIQVRQLAFYMPISILVFFPNARLEILQIVVEQAC